MAYNIIQNSYNTIHNEPINFLNHNFVLNISLYPMNTKNYNKIQHGVAFYNIKLFFSMVEICLQSKADRNT